MIAAGASAQPAQDKSALEKERQAIPWELKEIQSMYNKVEWSEETDPGTARMCSIERLPCKSNTSITSTGNQVDR